MSESDSPNKKNRNLWEGVRSRALGERKSSCLERNLLAIYLEGKVSKRQILSIEEHLATCSDCLDALIELRLLMKEKPEDVPVEVIERAKNLVMPSLPQRQKSAMRLPWWLDAPYLINSFRVAATATLIVVTCIAGGHISRKMLTNQKQIMAVIKSDISFELSDYFDFE